MTKRLEQIYKQGITAHELWYKDDNPETKKGYTPKKCEFLLCKDRMKTESSRHYCQDHKSNVARGRVLARVFSGINIKVDSNDRMRLIGLNSKQKLKEYLENLGVNIESVKE